MGVPLVTGPRRQGPPMSRWGKLTAEQKAPYEEQAKAEAAAYEKAGPVAAAGLAGCRLLGRLRGETLGYRSPGH